MTWTASRLPDVIFGLRLNQLQHLPAPESHIVLLSSGVLTDAITQRRPFAPTAGASYSARSLLVVHVLRPSRRLHLFLVILMTEERLLTGNSCDQESAPGWRQEAEAVIADIFHHVNHVSVSESLPCNQSGVYFNIESKEQMRVTVEMSAAGFRVCGTSYDSVSEVGGKCFETIYALLTDWSPGYRSSFSSALTQRLMQVSRDREKESDDKKRCES